MAFWRVRNIAGAMSNSKKVALIHVISAAVSTIPYTDSQLNHLLLLICNTFYRKYIDYIMKVLLPEATTKMCMDQFSLSHEETLQKIHKIHIASDTPDEKSLPW